MSMLHLEYQVPGDDFTRAGEASGDVKHKLKKLGYEPDAIRRIAIAMYEGEINLVIHGGGGEAVVDVDPDRVDIALIDQGPGIPDVEQAMQAGWSTAPDNVRALGFGAGMGLPNMKKYTDEMTIDSTVGVGTTVKMTVDAAADRAPVLYGGGHATLRPPGCEEGEIRIPLRRVFFFAPIIQAVVVVVYVPHAGICR